MRLGPYPRSEGIRRVSHVDSSHVEPDRVPKPARSSLHSFSNVAECDRFAVFADRRASPYTSLDSSPMYDGLLLFELAAPTSRSVSCEAIIHSLYVDESQRKSGLGASLVQEAYAMAASEVQSCLPPGREVKVTWRLAPGSCRRRADTLLCLGTQAWRVVLNAEKRVDLACIRRWMTEGKDLNRVDIDVYGPMLMVGEGTGCLSLAFESGLSQFAPPQDLQPPPFDVKRFKRSFQMCGEVMMSRLPFEPAGLKCPSDRLGLSPFVIPLKECQILEAYLSDDKNYGYGDVIDKDGNVTKAWQLQLNETTVLPGYTSYSTLNTTHNATLQAHRTMRTSSPAEVKVSLAVMPGLKELLGEALKKIGLAVQPGHIHEHVLHLHFLLLDEFSQVDFGWHEDTYDLYITGPKRDGVISIIIQLSTSFSTAMQVYGFPYYEFKGQGCGVAFLARCLHRSVSRRPIPSGYAVWKVAAFVHPVARRPRLDHISNVYDLDS